MVHNLQKLASIPETWTSIWRLKGLDGLNVNNVSHKSHTYRRWSTNWQVKCELLHQNYIMVGAYEFNKAPTCPDPRWRSALTFQHVLKPPPIRTCLVVKSIISSNKSSENIELSAEYQQTQPYLPSGYVKIAMEYGPFIVDLPIKNGGSFQFVMLVPLKLPKKTGAFISGGFHPDFRVKRQTLAWRLRSCARTCTFQVQMRVAYFSQAQVKLVKLVQFFLGYVGVW